MNTSSSPSLSLSDFSIGVVMIHNGCPGENRWYIRAVTADRRKGYALKREFESSADASKMLTRIEQAGRINPQNWHRFFHPSREWETRDYYVDQEEYEE